MNVKKLKAIMLGLLLANIIVVGYLLHLKNGDVLPFCKMEEQVKYIHGRSMEPSLMPEQKIKVLLGYYDCHEIKRNDIVAISYMNGERIMGKFVKAIPGDNFFLKKKNGSWQVYVNGKILLNSEGMVYDLDINRAKMLALYEKDYNRIIPNNAYLILGNITSGSRDSTQFGLISKEKIIGKVELR